MAITKIHPIKSTLKKALDYITNPAKTDEKLLVSSYGCGIETADIEFEKTRQWAMNKGNNLAHHLIQAFEPGEVDYEKAHAIGKQLADEILGGKYEYVISTHIDKGHVHNHIIFCAVDFAEHKKYISNRKSYGFIRRTSDRLCKENGLSVVIPGADRGKHYAEWDAQRKGTSYKAKLKIAIDKLIPVSADIDDLLRRLEAEGYEIKRGKYISFRAPGQERFTRCKTLGEAYTEEAIAERIKGKVITKELKPLYDEYKKSRDKEKYLRGHESEIILFEAAAKALKASGVSGKLPDLAKLKADYKRLTSEKDALYTEYGKLKKQLREYDAVKQNIDSILHSVRGREQEKAL